MKRQLKLAQNIQVSHFANRLADVPLEQSMQPLREIQVRAQQSPKTVFAAVLGGQNQRFAFRISADGEQNPELFSFPDEMLTLLNLNPNVWPAAERVIAQLHGCSAYKHLTARRGAGK